MTEPGGTLSSTGTWIVGSIPDTETRELIARFPGVLTAHTPATHAESLAWWHNCSDQETFFEESPGHSWCRPTDAAYRLDNLVQNATPDTDAANELWDACLDLMDNDDTDTDSVFVAAARKANPVAALYYALGAARSRFLPGQFATFLLPHTEVTAALPAVEQALRLTDAQQTTVIQRISTWMTGMGDAPEFDATDLIDGPQRVLRNAAATGHGIAAFTRWY